MAHKRKAKKKDDLRKNPDKIDISMGRYYLKMGLVKIIDKQNKLN